MKYFYLIHYIVHITLYRLWSFHIFDFWSDIQTMIILSLIYYREIIWNMWNQYSKWTSVKVAHSYSYSFGFSSFLRMMSDTNVASIVTAITMSKLALLQLTNSNILECFLLQTNIKIRQHCSNFHQVYGTGEESTEIHSMNG